MSIPHIAPCLGGTVLFKLAVPKNKYRVEHVFVLRKEKVNTDKKKFEGTL